MSKKAESLVWERSRAKGSALLMLVRIADLCPNDEGRDAWPSTEFLARETRLTLRAAQYILHRLERTGELVIEPNTERRTIDRAGRRFQPPYYLHIRCVCDWSAYASEPGGKFANFASSPFQRGRRKSGRQIAKFAHSPVPVNRKDCAEIRNPDDGNSKNHVAHIRKDPLRDPLQEQEQGAAPPTAPEHAKHEDTKPDDPNDNLGVITKLAHETIDLLGSKADLGDIADGVKSQCAQLKIAHWPGDVVRRAIDSALYQRTHARGVR